MINVTCLFFFSSILLPFVGSIPFLLFLKYDKYLEKNNTIIQSKVPEFRDSSSMKSWNCSKKNLIGKFSKKREKKRRIYKIICIKYLLWNFQLYTTVTNVVAQLRGINKNRVIKRIKFMLLWSLSQLPW